MACRHPKKGDTCSCSGYIKRLKDDKCGVCKHPKPEHDITLDSASIATPVETDTNPEFTCIDSKVRGILRRFADSGTQDPPTSLLPTRPSGSGLQGSVRNEEAARAETIAGYRPKKARSKSASVPNKPGGAVRPSKIGRVTIITCGLNSDGTLANTRCPTPAHLLNLASSALSVENVNGETLWFLPTWDSARIERWLRELFPQPLSWADRFGVLEEGQYCWKLVAKHYQTLFVYEKAGSITGDDLFRNRGSSSRSFRELELRFVLTHAIPSSVYADWDAAMLAPLPSTDTEPAQDVTQDQQDDSDTDSVIITRRRSTRLNKGKSRQVISSPEPESGDGDDQSVIDLADSDDEDLPPIISFFDDPPPAMSKPAIAGTSRKRPRSATIPDENAGVKKLKVKNEDNAGVVQTGPTRAGSLARLVSWLVSASV